MEHKKLAVNELDVVVKEECEGEIVAFDNPELKSQQCGRDNVSFDIKKEKSHLLNVDYEPRRSEFVYSKEIRMYISKRADSTLCGKFICI